MATLPTDAPQPRVLITAGPTAEDIDPVRFITNRSTGRMGIEIAHAVKECGGTPLLVLGPTHLRPDPDIRTVNVRSAASMFAAVTTNLGWADCLVMAAAVADYTPAEPLDRKLKKKEGDLTLRLKRTQDILAGIRDMPERHGKCVIGFSLDVGENLDEGRRKLKEKKLDLIVVNTIASFGSDSEVAHILGPDSHEDCGCIAKDELARRLVCRIVGSI